jgi:hypothetical protein
LLSASAFVASARLCVQALEAQQFSDMCRSGLFPADATALQRFVREKGYVEGHPPRVAMYFHEYK